MAIQTYRVQGELYFDDLPEEIFEPGCDIYLACPPGIIEETVEGLSSPSREDLIQVLHHEFRYTEDESLLVEGLIPNQLVRVIEESWQGAIRYTLFLASSTQ